MAAQAGFKFTLTLTGFAPCLTNHPADVTDAAERATASIAALASAIEALSEEHGIEFDQTKANPLFVSRRSAPKAIAAE